MEDDTRPRRERLRDLESSVLEHGSPAFVCFEDTIRENYRTLRTALDDHYPDSRVHFAAKANFNLGVLSVLADAGCGAEAFSGCELTAALEAGFDPSEVLLTGMNRAPDALERALEAGVDHLLVDNEDELRRVEAAAEATDTTPGVLLRGNPAMEVPTNPDVATATRESKFGLDVDSGRAMAAARRIVDSDAVTLAGIQLHIGSQIRDTEAHAVATRAMFDFAADARDELGVEIDVLDMGGGFPVTYDEAMPETATIVAAIATAIREGCRAHDLPVPTLFLEPGRRLVADAAALVATVGGVKTTPASTFAILDAGTNVVSSHWPYPVYALDDREATETYDVAGPLCYTGDVVAEGVSLPPLEPGDRLVVDRVGAYSLGSASHTNATPKPPVLLVRSDDSVDLVREPETCTDVLGHDTVPSDLR